MIVSSRVYITEKLKRLALIKFWSLWPQNNELLIVDMPYISSQNSYLFIRVNVAPFSTFNAFNITNLKKKGQRHKIMKMKI